MKVSVIVLSYNHGLYIGQTLETILEQKTNFEFEILVGDDCSKDNSRAIINQYFESFPNKIKKIFPEKNLGPNPNYLNCFKFVEGKYIAFCEGDDYWIDANKLQKQVDFLEQNPQYGGVCTNNRWFIESDNVFKNSILEEGIITFESLSESNKINSQTILYKRELIKDLGWMTGLKIGDWALHLLITSQQPYYRLPEITTVYRVHEGGIHSLLKEEQKIRNRIEVLIAVLENLNLSHERQTMLMASLEKLLKNLIGYHPEDIKVIRKKYFEYGGTVFNKTVLKSYLK